MFEMWTRISDTAVVSKSSHNLLFFTCTRECKGRQHFFRQWAPQYIGSVGNGLHVDEQQVANHFHTCLCIAFRRTHQQVVAVSRQKIDGVAKEGHQIFRESLCFPDALEKRDYLRRRSIPIAVREEHEHGGHAGRRFRDEPFHHFKQSFYLSSLGCVQLVLDADEKHNAEGAAAADCSHDGCRIGSIDRNILIVVTTDVVETRSINVGKASRRIVVAVEQHGCGRRRVANVASFNLHLCDELHLDFSTKLVVLVRAHLYCLHTKLSTRKEMQQGRFAHAC
mmetsp:Transcript_79610/g.129009  ORF Transcript_79610/g.129009 Transcript_79610/m.129009 type:complete len:280 (+) Transcript_79610:7416-8255(+)